MQQLVAGRARLLVALLSLLVLVVGLTLTAQARAQTAEVDCDVPEVETTPNASEAGGTLITVITECTGKADAELNVKATAGGATVFKAVLAKTVSGSISDTDAIHLPPLLEDEVCVSINDNEVCTPTL